MVTSAGIVHPLSFLKALADETRLAIVEMLARTDLTAGEIRERLDMPQNVVSYHLRQLRRAGVLRDRRSSHDARDVYYSVDYRRAGELYTAVGAALYAPASYAGVELRGNREDSMPIRVLFLCTGNSARSQMAEAFMSHIGGPGFEAFSAGSQPADRVHPMTIEVMEEIDIPLSGAHPKHMSQFLADRWDFVITVCDRARDACPTFPGDTQRIHWGFDDPAAAEGTEEERRRVFQRVRDEILNRIRLFAATFEAQPARSK